MERIVTLLMASQPGEGFSGSRWLAPWGRVTLLEHVVACVGAWSVPLELVVLGAQAEEVVARIDFGDATVLVDPEWREGEAASLRAGLDYLQRLADVETVLLADAAMPTVPPEVAAQLAATHRASSRPATVPKYRYVRGRPLLLDRELWPRLLGLEGAVMPESILATHERWVEEVWLDQLAPGRVDTPEDLEDLAPRR